MATGAARRRLALLSALSAVWVLLSCAPALAHANLVSSSPPAGSETPAPPGRVELRFNEPVNAEFDPLVVRDSDGKRVDEGDARVDPQDARVVLATLEELSAGSYTVEWRVTSIDGHVVEGRYGFAVTGADGPSDEGRGAAGTGAEGPTAEDRKNGQAEREPATGGGGPDGSAPILAYGAMSLGVVAAVVAAALLVSRLARRPKP